VHNILHEVESNEEKKKK
jgi:hypothetical protein